MRESPDSLSSGLISATDRAPGKRPKGSGKGAFTLIEVLLVVGVISILGGASVAVVGHVQESSRVAKLESDVATVNSAIQVYQASGGVLPGGLTPQQVLDQLKTAATAASAAKIAGFHGSVIDPRITVQMQTGGDAGAGKERAQWDATAQRFVLTTTGDPGVDHFALDETAGQVNYGTETRTDANTRGTNKSWVWNYVDTVAGVPGGPAVPGVGVAAATVAPGALVRQKLSAPTFSTAPGNLPLVNFDLPITLTNPNPAGVSQVWYNIGAGDVQYTGTPISVAPGASLIVTAKTIDPDHWTNSDAVSGIWHAIPFQPQLSVSVPASTMTYAQAGGAMTSGGTITPSPATVNITNIAGIPSKYRSSNKFQVYYTMDGSSPLTSGVAGPAFNGTYVSPSIGISPANWGSSSTLVISAAARAVDTSMFVNSTVATASIGISPTALVSPVIDPASGSKAVDLPVSIALATGVAYPLNARIYYTIDGTDPGNNNGEPTGGATLYTGQFNSGAGTNGVVVVTARAYGPTGYGNWFTPSPAIANTYATVTLSDGALVGSATLNGTFVGSLVYATPAAGGTMSNITFNKNAQIIGGNLYLPGEPSILRTNGTVWSVANDSLFASVIQGWEYDSAGAKTVQTTPRVIEDTGSIIPNNYSVTFNNSALLEGKVIRRHNSPAFPTIAPPPAPDSLGSASLNSAPAGPISASQYSNVTLNSSSVGAVRLLAGNYANLIANNGDAFILGDPLNPTVTQYYSFQSLTLNSRSNIQIVGKVIVTVSNSININSGSVLGNSSHPEWFQLQFSSGSFTANSGSTTYAELVVPTGSVTFNAGSTFSGSVTAQSLTINSNSVIFSLPPVIQN